MPTQALDAAPREVADITESWILNALEQGGHAVSSRVISVKQETVGAGIGMFSELKRLWLTYETPSPQDPASLILKMPSMVAANRSRAVAFDMYAREARFYREVAEGLNIRVPRCYWSSIDPRTRQATLLLEDLGGLDTEGQIAGIDPRRASVAVTRLAAAHAQWWESAQLADLHWMPSLASPMTRQLAQVYRDQWPAFVEKYGRLMPAAALPLGERVRDSVEELLEELSKPPVTIVHGDFRVDNLFFDGGSDSDPLVVADWQLTCRGRGAFDVAYLLCQSMTIANRRRHEMTILRSWHETLLASGITAYSIDDAIDDYKRGALICLGYAVAGTVLDRANEHAHTLARVQAVRTCTAALDLRV